MKVFFPVLFFLTALTLLGVWWGSGMHVQKKYSLALRTVMPTDLAEVTPVSHYPARTAMIEGTFTAGQGKPSSDMAFWPCFRGPDLNHIAPNSPRLAEKWPVNGPPVLWEITLGDGYAGASAYGGCIYIMDYDEVNRADTLRCLSLDNAEEIWRFSYPVYISENHGKSRTVPAVDEQYVVALGPLCHVVCLERVSGKLLWLIDLKEKYGTKIPEWYAGQCPVLDSGHVILAPGGKDALLVSLDCRTGKEVWSTPNPRGWEMTHSSLTPMMLDGRKIWIYFAMRGLIGVDAQTGEPVWETLDWKGLQSVSPSPVVLPDNRIFCAGGFNAGSVMLTLVKNENVSVSGGNLKNQNTGIQDKLYPDIPNEVKWSYTVKTKFWKHQKFSSMQHTPIFYKGFIYGVREVGKQLVCFTPEGKECWTSGAKNRYGWGPYMVADGKLFLMDDNGMFTMASILNAQGEGGKVFRILDQAVVFQDALQTWGPFCFAHGRMIFRDRTRMKCLDLRERQPES